MPVVYAFLNLSASKTPSAENRPPGPDSASAQREADLSRAKTNAIQNIEAGASTTLGHLEAGRQKLEDRSRKLEVLAVLNFGTIPKGQIPT
jgi:hypothetical protein